MPPDYPADWPSNPSLPIRFAAVWNLHPSDQYAQSATLLAPHERQLLRAYQEGPARAWACAAGKVILGWFPGLRQYQVAELLGLTPGHFGRLVSGENVWTLPLLLAALEQARRYAARQPQAQTVRLGLQEFLAQPTGLAYRRAARMRAMLVTDHALRRQGFARAGQRDAIFKGRSLACWEFELLDVLLGNHQRDWLHYSRRYEDLAPVLLGDANLQVLVRDCALEASRRPCLSELDRERLVRLPDQVSLGYAACKEICRLFNDWQEAWKATTDFVGCWEEWSTRAERGD